MIFVVTFILGILLYVIIKSAVKSKGKKLQRKFISLGNMTGKTKQEIIAKCGNFKSIKNIQGGSICVWMDTGYIMTLQFDSNDVFVKICSETAV